jgi:hypothetical protein
VLFRSQLTDLVGQVQSATLDTVNAIAWTPATY